MTARSQDRSIPKAVAKRGVSRFGELEAAVMEVLWRREGWMTPGEVRDALTQGSGLAYTTVMTVLVRLWKKGLLERERDGRAFAYHPMESREYWTARRMEELLAAAGNASEALNQFVGVLKPVERDQLRRILLSGHSS